MSVLLALVLLLHAPAAAAQGKSPVAHGTGGAAATVDEHATQAALEILRQGGNAVDAAVAAAAMLGVTEPFMCGIGGGGFLVIYLAREGRVVTLDSRETAPAAFTPEALLDERGVPIPFDERVTSGLSAGVPGTALAWEEALRRFGTISLAAALGPAIRVAEEGFPVDGTYASFVASNVGRFRAFTSTRDTFLTPSGGVPPVGATVHNPDLARTYRLLAAEGSEIFYRGEVAEAIVDAVQHPPVVPGAGLHVRPGLMTRDDLAGYQVRVRPPVVSAYRDYTVYGMGPPSSGGPTVALALNLLEGYDLAALPRDEALHLVLEASRLAFADRNAYLGDAEFVEVPLAGLLSQGYADARRAAIPDYASGGLAEPGDPYPYQPEPAASRHVSARAPNGEGVSTTHLTVADAEGNVVSYTFTIESIGGNGIVVPGYGFLLNNELTDFDPVPPHPNAPDGGKRPRSSMTPTIVLADGRPVLAVGSPGGPTIITTVLHILVNYLDFGLDLPAAIAAPRASQRNTAATLAEPGFSGSATGWALRARGHQFAEQFGIGLATGIAFHGDGTRTAAAEPVRGGGGSALVEQPSE